MSERSTGHGRSPAGQSLLAGDLARLLRESMRCVHGPVALLSVTQPPDFDNSTAARRWRALCARLRTEMMRRHGLRSPRVVAQVCHRQGRGADHLHRILLCRTPGERERIARWVELYREFGDRYGFGYVDDPLHPRHPKLPGGRPDRSKPRRDMVFRDAATAGHYAGGYLAGGQLERTMGAGDRSWRVYWISPTLLRMSGWSLQRCKWVRQGWRVLNGSWGLQRPPFGTLVTRRPSWWFRPDDRAWVLATLGAT